MSAQIIDGKAFANVLCTEIAGNVGLLAASNGVVPGLAVVLVGSDPASEVYVRSKASRTKDVGMKSFEYRLPETTSEADLHALIANLNVNDEVDGILVQLPLPRHIDAEAILSQIDPVKDVDGFHPLNAGLLAVGKGGPVPCTPLGCVLLIKSIKHDLRGANAVIVGRSNIVGKPVAQLLLAEDCTVTIAHSKTQRLDELCRTADILVAAVGRPEMISGSWIKPGAVVIDVGINRVVVNGKSRLVGDVQYSEALKRASAITPVPGGVGPMTIACLLRNTVDAAKRRRGLS